MFLRVFLFVIAIFSIISIDGQIIIDGNHDDWGNIANIHLDGFGDGNTSGIDFGALQMTNDQEFLYFRLDVSEEINLQSSNRITIYIDVDDDSDTGKQVDDLGAEIEFTFGERDGRLHTDNGSSTIYHNDLLLVTANTVSDDIFEWLIKRDLFIEGNDYFLSNKIKVLIRDESNGGDQIPNDAGLVYTFNEDNLPFESQYSLRKPDGTDVRIMSYNVLFDGLFDQSRFPSFKRIIQGMQPTIIGFQEIYDYSSAEVAERVEDIINSDQGQQWYHARQNPDIHCISRYPIIESFGLAGNGAFFIDIPDVKEDMLLIVAHPPCCDKDQSRQEEIDLIMSFIRDAKAGIGPRALQDNAPIVIIGDMNLVGYKHQLETLITGNILYENQYGPDFTPDWNGDDFIDASPVTTGLPMAFTWYSENSSYSPGRLDFTLFSGSNMNMLNSFALFTSQLPADSLIKYGMQKNDGLKASDHLPVVSDFEFVNTVSEFSVDQKTDQVTLYPNPVSDQLVVDLQDVESKLQYFKITDNLGKAYSFSNRITDYGTLVQSIDVTGLESGAYVLSCVFEDRIQNYKFVISR